MTTTSPYNNHSLVGNALRLLTEGLGPYVAGKMNEAVASGRYDPQAEEAIGEITGDVAVTLRVMVMAWNDVFRDHLGPVERSLVSEIRETRNRWAHQEAFDDDDLDRALDSIGRLLGAVGAIDEAKRIDGAKHRLRLRRYGATPPEAAASADAAPAPEADPEPAAGPAESQPSAIVAEPITHQAPLPGPNVDHQSAETGRDDDRVQEHIHRGVDYRRQEHFAHAMAEFEQALSIDPRRADSWFHRGMTWGLMDDHRRAIGDFDRAIFMAPDYAAAYNCRGYARFCLGEYRQAVEDLERANRLDPDDELTQGNLQQARIRFLQQPGDADRTRRESGPLH